MNQREMIWNKKWAYERQKKKKRAYQCELVRTETISQMTKFIQIMVKVMKKKRNAFI